MSRTLLESMPSISSATGIEIDRGQCLIKGVKILGCRSVNAHGQKGVKAGSRYTANALARAAQLYEGMVANTNHNPRNDLDREREVMEPFGRLQNCRPTDDGVYGDVRYNAAHPFPPILISDIEQNLGVYGFSHNAVSGRDWVEDGVLVIDDIAKVRSVDIVTRPATTRNLRESVEMPSTLRSIVESILPKLKPNVLQIGRNLLEDDGAYMDAPAPDASAAMEPDEALKVGFRTAINAVIEAIFGGEMEPKAGMKKIDELFKTHFKLASGDEKAGEEVEETEASKAVTESVASTTATPSAELEALRVRDHVRDLCESKAFIPTKVQLKALTASITDAERLELIESFRPAQTTGQRPRSAPPRTEGQTAAPKVGQTAADGIALLRRGSGF